SLLQLQPRPACWLLKAEKGCQPSKGRGPLFRLKLARQHRYVKSRAQIYACVFYRLHFLQDLSVFQAHLKLITRKIQYQSKKTGTEISILQGSVKNVAASFRKMSSIRA